MRGLWRGRGRRGDGSEMGGNCLVMLAGFLEGWRLGG
jgi:hypothetical protein